MVAAGVTLQETMIAYENLLKEKISIRVVDAFCLKVYIACIADDKFKFSLLFSQ